MLRVTALHKRNERLLFSSGFATDTRRITITYYYSNLEPYGSMEEVDMTVPTSDDGVITALLERLEKQRLPRILRMKESVFKGERLAESEVEFLSQVLEDTTSVKPLADTHPYYQTVVVKAISLYHEITEQALKNEQNLQAGGPIEGTAT